MTHAERELLIRLSIVVEELLAADGRSAEVLAEVRSFVVAHAVGIGQSPNAERYKSPSC